MAFSRMLYSEGWMRAKSLKTKVAEAHGNRTHRAHLPVNPTGFEVQASHQARFTSAMRAIVTSDGRPDHELDEFPGGFPNRIYELWSVAGELHSP